MKRIPLLFAMVVLFVAACGPAQVKAPPDGTYTREEVTSAGTNQLSIVLNQGQFVMNLRGSPLWQGTYQVVGGKLAFKSLKDSVVGAAMCGGSEDDFSYLWTYDSANKQLKFAQDNDPCAMRMSGTLGGTWTFQPG